jgi:hypothetical protein
MPRRTATMVPAILAGILAGISLTTMARGEPANVEDCLPTPKAETPAGSHWRYHIDHANKRNCWYLRRDDGGVSQALPLGNPPAPAPAAKPSIADARAELRPQAIREDTPAVSPPPNAASNETSSANASVWNATAAVATRWPDLPAAVSAPTAAQAPVAPAPASDVTTSPAAPAPSIPFAYLSAPVRPEMIPIVVTAIIGALAFAGAAAFMSRRRRRLSVPKARSARGPIWETTDDDRIVLSDYPSVDNRDYRPRFARSVGSATAVSPEFVRRPPRRAAR